MSSKMSSMLGRELLRPRFDFGPGIFDPASDRQPRGRLHGDASAEYRVFVFEVTVVDAPRTWTDAEKVFLRIVLPAPECSDRHPSVREIRQVEPRLDRPIPFKRGGGPYAEGAFAIEQPAIAESGTVREPAAGREAAQLQMEAVRSGEKSRQALLRRPPFPARARFACTARVPFAFDRVRASEPRHAFGGQHRLSGRMRKFLSAGHRTGTTSREARASYERALYLRSARPSAR